MVAAMPLGLPDVGTVFLYPFPPLAKSSKKEVDDAEKDAQLTKCLQNRLLVRI
jgi:hypothetical protein